MKVLVACEFSGIVRDAFIQAGHDAISCDLLPSETKGPHIQGDVRDVDLKQFDLMIAHPPCTYLTSAGARWMKGDRLRLQEEALDFVLFLMNAPTPRKAVENPIGVISSRVRKPDQIVDPWQFGDLERKAICLWLYDLPKLHPTITSYPVGVRDRIHKEGPGPDRWKRRSRFYSGIADAMASQWGSL